MATIAFIGLGNMGNPMAANLVKAGHKVQGFDLVSGNLETAKTNGVTIVSNAAAAVNGAEIFITMLPAGRHVLSVYGDIVSKAAPGTLFVDSSTIDVDWRGVPTPSPASTACRRSTHRSPAAFRAQRQAPSPSWPAARKRPSPAPSRSSNRWAGRVIHCGGAGAGQSAKICNNMILGISMIGVGEAFVLAEKLGLSHQALFDVASTSSGQCWSITTYCPVPGPVPTSPANNDYKPGFAAGLMLKDLKLAQEAAQSAGAITPLGAEAAQIYALFNACGNEGVDFSGIINFLRGQDGD